MPQERVNLQELLDYRDSHAPWFALNEDLPHAQVKRNLKFLRGLNGSSRTTLEALDRLTEQEINEAVVAYKIRSKQSTNTSAAPTTSPQFFYSIMAKSAYFSEIIPYSGSIQKSPTNPQSTTFSASASVRANPETTPKKTEPVHGFHLNEGEAFSSTRYFSEDKKSYAQIVAKNGAFQANYQHLNHEHKTDVAFEIGFQFLLNMSPDNKTVHLSGSPEMVHRMRAAFLYLQKEAGTRYADLTFKLPEGMSIAPDELNDVYIKTHLGALNETPQQVVQWRHFLKMESNTPKNTSAPTPPEKKKPSVIDMERVFHAPDLSQQDKMVLHEYQRYLKDVWVERPKEGNENTQNLIAEHEEFIQRTETVLHLLKKTPSLEREFEALKILYTGTVETHLEILESLQQIDIEYDAKRKELLAPMQKTRREALEGCVHSIKEHLKIEITLNPNLSEEFRTGLERHEQNMNDVTKFIQDKEELSDEMMRSCGAQMLHTLNFLESTGHYSNSPLFQKMKEFSKEQSEKKEKIRETTPEQLMQASNHVKERLNQFKKDFQQPKEPEISLDAQIKEQLKALIKKVKLFIEGMEAEDSKPSLELLSTTLKQISGSSVTSNAQVDALHKCLDDNLPHIQDNPEFVQVLSQIKTLITAPSVSDASPPEQNNLQGQAM